MTMTMMRSVVMSMTYPAPKAILFAGETMHRLFLQKVFQGILEPAGYVVNFAGRIFVPALDQT